MPARIPPGHHRRWVLMPDELWQELETEAALRRHRGPSACVVEACAAWAKWAKRQRLERLMQEVDNEKE